MNDLQAQFVDSESSLPHMPIGRHLVNSGVICQKDLLHALDLQCYIDAPLGDVLVSEGLIRRDHVLDALSRQSQAARVDLNVDPPAPGMAEHLSAGDCLAFRVVPWRMEQGRLYVAISQPHAIRDLRRRLGPGGPVLVPLIADEAQISSHLSRLYGAELVIEAARRVPAAESCRNWAAGGGRRARWAAAAVCGIGAMLALAPFWTITIAMAWATLTLVMSTVLKALAFWFQVSHKVPERSESFNLRASRFRLPQVSVLVPLLKEKEIARDLIARLGRLTYPKSLLNVVLVLEEDDEVTRETLANTDLPPWMSVIEVPGADGLTTKPRALNYALNFCRGSIIGVWDAEDWPETDQIERVVTRFNEAPENVACLQGILDYYNSRTNWMSRCFAIEYATWWRILLPGIARMGLVVPLGGTTLFFRRDILERLGGWDAHNVTEDADLGLRLARHGYVTELLPTVTHEEATCRPWPWVRQRSRWLKGFMITYLVHMRDPARLLRDLGPARFLGVQTMFLATFSQFACAPLLWSFWLTVAGFAHPVQHTLGSAAVWTMVGLFLAAEILNIAMGLVAVSGRGHRHLMAFVPTMMVYFMLGAVAAYKAMWEMMRSPFFWDKTQHGVTSGSDHPSS